MHGDGVMNLAESEPEHTTEPRSDATFDTISPAQLYDVLALSEGSRSIRLLDLDAPSGSNVASNNSESLTGHLRVACLENSPSFAALSYVWGERSTLSHGIICRPHGCRIEITANCHAALCQIRKRFGAVTIWLDSVCINQADEGEKAHQIPLMREIYTWAEETYVWLGPGNDEAYQAMDWMRERSASMTPIPLGLLAAKSKKKRREELARFAYILWRDAIWRITHFNPWFPRNSLRNPAPTSIDGLLSRSWAQRVWTFQEIALSAAPIVLCGDRCISWEDVVSAVYDFKRLEKDCDAACTSAALDCWKSTIDLWLCIPRDAYWNGNALREGLGSASSFEGHIKDLVKYHGVLLCILRLLTKGVIPSLYLLAFFGICINLMFFSDGNRLFGSELAFNLLGIILPGLGFVGFGTFFLNPAVLVGYPPSELLLHIQERVLDCERQALIAIRIALLGRVSSIPHDRSFALSGVLSSFGVAASTPDYTQPLGETYLCLFKNLIAWKPYAIALLLDSGSPRLPNTPTWVPHWGTPRPAPWLVSRYQTGTYMSLMDSGIEIEPIICWFSITGSRLSISGTRRGTVSFQTTLGATGGSAEVTSPNCPPSVAEAITWLNRIRETRQPACVIRTGRKDELAAVFSILRSLTPARKNPDSCVTPWLRGFSYDFFGQRESFELFRAFYVKCLKADQNPEGAWESMDDGPAGHRKYFLDMLESVTSDGRCLLVLGNGLVGSGPLDVRCGDEVFLLRGVPAPMVLRPTGQGTYTVVGAALVHGLMQGEGLSHGFFNETVELV